MNGPTVSVSYDASNVIVSILLYPPPIDDPVYPTTPLVPCYTFYPVTGVDA